ncbi:MAG: twin-arginine translocase subunit TatC, partial [Candidatus Nanopelagicales bacterium]
MPNALGFLLGFTPENVSNIVDVDRYVSFFLNTVIMFGIGFLLPLFALLLNLAGVLPAKTLINAWRWILLGTFFFAAVATPDGNPFTMTMLAVPIMLLLTAVMAIAWLNDRRKGRAAEADQVPDDQISSLDDVTPID